MIYTPLTNQAMKIAFDAHDGQYDKAGIPYIFHPMHLAEQFTDETLCCVALLHDVLEDSELEDSEFIDEALKDFPKNILVPLRLLTRQEGVPYLDYIREIAKHDVARKVKIADLQHNLNWHRFEGTDQEMSASLEVRYLKALEILGAGISV